MASVSREAKGWRIDFRQLDGQRRVIRVGNKRHADEISAKIRELIAARAAGVAPDPSVAAWLGRLDDNGIRARLVECGLAPRRESDRPLVEWLDQFLERHGVKVAASDGTRRIWARARGHAQRYFGTRLLSSITQADAEGFREALLAMKGRIAATMAEATVRKMCGVLSQSLRAAARSGVITSNPFDEVPTAAGANHERDAYVEAATLRRVMEVAGSDELRLLFALSRFAGLRIPSEIRELRWGAIDWSERALRVDSPKTRRHGKPWRLVPLVPELFALLELAYSDAPERAEFIFPTLRVHSNLGVPLARAIRSAGLEVWPRPFHTLRASCETDWAQRLPLADVAAWLGHTRAVAARHYLRPTGASFAAATELPSRSSMNFGGDTSGDKFASKGIISVVTPVVTQPAACSRALLHDQRKPIVSSTFPAVWRDVAQKETTGCDEPVVSSGEPYRT